MSVSTKRFEPDNDCCKHDDDDLGGDDGENADDDDSVVDDPTQFLVKAMISNYDGEHTRRNALFGEHPTTRHTTSYM